MTDPDQDNLDSLFFQLVTTMHSAALMQLGKFANPMTGKAERLMTLAQNTIDLLAMIRAKTEGNLTEPERTYLDHVLYELRMNFIDESEHPSSATEDTPAKTDAPPAPEM